MPKLNDLISSKEIREKTESFSMLAFFSLNVINKFDVKVEINAHNYNGIKDPYLLTIKMRDSFSFVCCGLSEEEARILNKLLQ